MQTMFEICAVASDIDFAITFLRNKSIIKAELNCDRCDLPMKTVKDKNRLDGCLWRCYKCDKRLSIRTGSFLSRSKLSIKQFIGLFYLWTLKTPVEQASIMLGASEHTIVDWSNLLREVCSAKFLEESGPTLGGPGCVIQIDESVIYRPKYNRGHALFEQSKWVFGLYDVEKKVGAIEFVQNRSADTLLPLIKKHVKPGSVIHSDEWAAYAGINSIAVDPLFIHETVNHSVGFKNRDSGVHTNNVEAYWSSIKRRFKILNGTSRALTASYLDEHMYRERFGRTYPEMFNNIMKDISDLGF